MKNSKTCEVISARLKELRLKAGYTQADVSVDLNIKLPTYQSYEEGRCEPSLATLKKLANLYELPSIENLIDFSLILVK